MRRDATERSVNRVDETQVPRTALPAYVSPSAARSRNMAAVERSNTKPETDLRHALHAAGFRYRKDYPIRLEVARAHPTRHRLYAVAGCCIRQ